MIAGFRPSNGWETGGTIDDYAGSAGGNNTYSGGEGWVELSWEWTAPFGTSIYFPSGLVGSETESWSGVKALFR